MQHSLARISSFIDSVRKPKGKTGSYKRQIYMITEQYIKKGIKDENLKRTLRCTDDRISLCNFKRKYIYVHPVGYT